MKKIKRIILAGMLLCGCAGQSAATRVVEVAERHARVFLPDTTECAGAVVILPGGGYSHTAINHEGYDWAPFFNSLGLACAVVDYTMPHGDRSLPIGDALGAMKMMRDSAAVWHIAPDRIGVMGSSAGGHLASTVATQAPEELRPDFQILFYPVVTMDTTYTHRGSHDNLLGPDATAELERQYSGELQVTPQTPRAFLALSADDRAVPPRNSLDYCNALLANGVPVSLFMWPTGGHGWGSRTSFKYHTQMEAELASWLESF